MQAPAGAQGTSGLGTAGGWLRLNLGEAWGGDGTALGLPNGCSGPAESVVAGTSVMEGRCPRAVPDRGVERAARALSWRDSADWAKSDVRGLAGLVMGLLCGLLGPKGPQSECVRGPDLPGWTTGARPESDGSGAAPEPRGTRAAAEMEVIGGRGFGPDCSRTKPVLGMEVGLLGGRNGNGAAAGETPRDSVDGRRDGAWRPGDVTPGGCGGGDM